MTSSTPNCAITLYFFEDSARFSYHMTCSSQGWQVLPDGSIHPPSRDRIVEIALKGYPESDLKFAGLQIVSDPREFPAKTEPWTPVESLTSLGVEVLSPATYPPTEPVPGPLTLEFGPPPPTGTPFSGLFYRLAVVVGDDTDSHWDDPKIYNDGSQ